jgi:hypothetical protein
MSGSAAFGIERSADSDQTLDAPAIDAPASSGSSDGRTMSAE